MAAMLAGNTRSFPQMFCRFANCKQLLGKAKLRPVQRYLQQSSGLSTKFVPVTAVKCDNNRHWYCNIHQTVRNFRTAAVLCSDVQTVKCPPFAESITEGDIRWEKAVGDAVNLDEIIAEVETDKTSIQIPSPVAGVIESLLVNDGDTVEAGMQLCTIKAGAEAAAGAKPSAPPPSQPKAPEAAAPPSQPPAAAAGPIPTTPPPAQAIPTGPISSTPVSEVKPRAAVPPMPAGDISTSGGRGESRVKMNRMRQRIAQRLKDAQNTCAMLTTFNEIDMSNIMDLRKQYKDAFLKTHGLKLGFMSAFVRASAYALQDQPQVNAVIDDLEIVYRDYVDISVAVSTPKGLVVPVIRNVEGMSYAEIEKAMSALGEKDLGLENKKKGLSSSELKALLEPLVWARTGNLAIEDMDGGTFTISNGGVFGSMFGTPIINPPQSAILGMHAIFDRPVSVNGKVEIRPMMYVALTYDHRLIDGREAVTFLKKIKSAVEDPRSMLLEL